MNKRTKVPKSQSKVSYKRTVRNVEPRQKCKAKQNLKKGPFLILPTDLLILPTDTVLPTVSEDWGCHPPPPLDTALLVD